MKSTQAPDECRSTAPEERSVETAQTKRDQNEKLVTLGIDDPQQLPTARKWLVVAVVSSAALCVTCGSSMAASTEAGIQRSFNISHEVSILGISLFVAGLGVGPLLLGPLSEFYGRNAVYWGSYTCYLLLGLPVALANNAPVHLIFRFFCGFAGSAFLSVAGGTVSDLYDDASVANPMAVYTLSPFLGPVLGPAISGFINQVSPLLLVGNDWRWTYYVLLIWAACELLALVFLVPETHVPTLLHRKAQR